MKVLNQTIDYIYIDNKSKDTLVCVHGLFSNKEFISHLGDEKNNFNIFSITLPLVENDKPLDLFIDIVREIINHHINGKVYLLGHSFGGLIVSKLSSEDKVKKVFYLNSVHPLITYSSGYEIMEKMFFPKTKIQKALSKTVSKSLDIANKIKDMEISNFLKEENPWHKIIKNYVFDRNLIQHELDSWIKNSLEKAVFICGENDRVIDSTLYKEYIRSLSKPLYSINGKHSPLRSNTGEIQKILNKEIEYRKRRFWNKK